MAFLTNDPSQYKLADFSAYAYKVTGYILFLGATLALILIIWSGINIISSGGNEEKVTTAKNTIKWSVVGLVVIASSKLIINYFHNLLK